MPEGGQHQRHRNNAMQLLAPFSLRIMQISTITSYFFFTNNKLTNNNNAYKNSTEMLRKDIKNKLCLFLVIPNVQRPITKTP